MPELSGCERDAEFLGVPEPHGAHAEYDPARNLNRTKKPADPAIRKPVVSNLRLVIENFRKYGVLICFTCHDYNPRDVQLGLLLYTSIPLHLLFAYLIELLAASRANAAVARLKRDSSSQHAAHRESQRRSFRTDWYLIALAHGVNATLNLAISTAVVYYWIHHPGIGFACELHAVIVWLKTCSYAFTNRDLRDALLGDSPADAADAAAAVPALYKSCPYPRNVSIRNLMYFWWAPTLVYQPVYPRTARVRWVFVAKRLAECGGLCIVVWFAAAQYAVPLLVNSLAHWHKLDVVSIAERVLKLSTISLACWLAGFFALFQSFLNALAEAMRFADREFYADWWNVASIRTYWTSWNKPVYHFMRRHIYAPLVARGVPRQLAQLLVFVFSGFLHELLVGVPTHNITGDFPPPPPGSPPDDTRT